MNDQATAMSRPWVFVLGIYLLVLTLVLVYVLIKIWPTALPVGEHDRIALLPGRLLEFEVAAETRYLLIVAVVGALGCYVHLGTSFVDFVGNRRLFESWGWWYVLRPFTSLVLALVLYFVFRGGLISGTSAASALNPYGVAALAGLAGMFSKQATDKLKEVFENLFKTVTPPSRADPLRAEEGRSVEGPRRERAVPPPVREPEEGFVVRAVIPNSTPYQSQVVPVTIVGSGFQREAQATFIGTRNAPSITARTTFVSENLLVVQIALAPGAQPGTYTYDVTVAIAGGTATLQGGFAVTAP